MGRFKHIFHKQRDLFVKNIDLLNEYISNFEQNKPEISDSVIAVGDIHGSFLQAILPLIISNYIKDVKIVEDEILYTLNISDIHTNIIVYLGDIFDYAYHDEYYLIVDMLIDVITTFNNSIFWCYGNHDTKEFLRLKNNIENLDEEELDFYNFSCKHGRVFYYNSYFNFIFSHTVIENEFFTKFSIIPECSDVWKFSTISESTYSETVSTYSEAISKYAEENETEMIDDEINKFNELILINFFNGNNDNKINYIDLKCFWNRYENINNEAFENINKVIGHDIVNLKHFNEFEKLYMIDFDAMHSKRRLLKTYIERPRFCIINDKGVNVKFFDNLIIK